MQLFIKKAEGIKGIKQRVGEIFSEFSSSLPPLTDASILIKPNLNANMNALTGNTTDLRLIAAVIEELMARGYTNITIGEGTNSGYYRNNISVISRLMVDRLAARYPVRVKDLNYSDPIEIEFEDGVAAGAARDALDADFIINLPKLKTHFEAGMSVCLKNLMGCLVGQDNKKKTHKNLALNILRINDALSPGLHIVDALISMEGLGPTRGVPVKTGFLMAGTDPYLIDLAAARVAGFDYTVVRTLRAAEETGRLGSHHHQFIKDMDLGPYERKFAPPVAGPLATFIHHPSRQKYFLAIRNTRLFTYLCSTRLAGKILYATGLRQDVFIEDEMEIESITVDLESCDQCGKCAEYCPLEMKLPEEIANVKQGCLMCLYCYMVCPTHSIKVKGKFGFLAEQLRQYDEIVREIT